MGNIVSFLSYLQGESDLKKGLSGQNQFQSSLEITEGFPEFDLDHQYKEVQH